MFAARLLRVSVANAARVAPSSPQGSGSLNVQRQSLTTRSEHAGLERNLGQKKKVKLAVCEKMPEQVLVSLHRGL